jgi:hypothetical protein
MKSFRVLAAGYRVETCLYDGEDIALRRCAPFAGRVRTSSGEPVAGATVTLDGMGIEQTLATGADGRFRFDAVPLHSSLYDTTLAVERPGFVRFRQELRLTDPPAAMDVRLSRGARFTGRVVRDGKPVPGAGVSAVGYRDLHYWPMLTGRIVERLAFAGRDGRFVMEAVPTDADGVFALYEEKEEPWRKFRTGTRSVAPAEGRTYDLGDLELRDHLPLRGRVLDHRGRPVKRLKLLCRPLFGLEETCREQTTETDPDGRFEFPDLPVGYWNVLAGPADDRLVADVVCPGDVLEFRLDPPE